MLAKICLVSPTDLSPQLENQMRPVMLVGLVLHARISAGVACRLVEGGITVALLLVGLIPLCCSLVPESLFIDAPAEGRIKAGLEPLEAQERTHSPDQDREEGEEDCSHHVAVSNSCRRLIADGPLVRHDAE